MKWSSLSETGAGSNTYGALEFPEFPSLDSPSEYAKEPVRRERCQGNDELDGGGPSMLDLSEIFRMTLCVRCAYQACPLLDSD